MLEVNALEQQAELADLKKQLDAATAQVPQTAAFELSAAKSGRAGGYEGQGVLWN